MELKLKKNESWEEFCVRTLNSHKDLGYTKKEVFKMLFDKDMATDNIRKVVYLADYILKSKEQGRDKLFGVEDSVDDKKEELNSFYKTDETIEVEDKELLLKSNQQLRKQVQAYQDKLRVLRAEHRSEFRKGNSVKELLDGLIEHIPKYIRTIKPNTDVLLDKDKVGVIHISDSHISKTVNLPMNIFNFEVARHRLLQYINSCVDTFSKHDINNCIVVFSGDILNLDSHGMIMTNEFKRSESLLKAFDLISELFEVLLSNGLNISTCSVLGNESRLYADQYMSNVDSEAKENLDYVVFQMLKRKFSDCVVFLNEGDSLEYLLQVKSHDIVVLHGHNLKHNNLNQEIDKVKIRYSKVTGKYPRFCLFGHVHDAMITNNYGRSGSIVGEDYYSTNTLNIPHSSVTQNLYLIDNDKITGTIIDCR